MLNILLQGIYTLALPIGLGALVSYLLTRFLNAPRWIWAIFLTAGALMGLYSMVKYILLATAALDRLEKERKERDEVEREKEEQRRKWVNNNDTE